MTLEGDGPNAAPEIGCPLRCRLLQSAASNTSPAGQAAARDQVDWAGLPVNLDLVFSSKQRDKVYVQHLLRKKETRLWSWLNDDPQLCAQGNDCPLVKHGERLLSETPAENRDLDPDAVKAYVRSLSADKRYFRDVS